LKACLAGILDAVFPPRCPTCNAIHHEQGPLPFCGDCTAKIRLIRPPLCPACGLPYPEGSGANHLCGNCLLTPKAFSVARAVGYYDGPFLSAIHDLKYRGKTALGKILGKLMAAYDDDDLHIPSFTLIVPVPLHISRLRERAFNQALLLARAVALRHAVPLDFTSLKRHIRTQPQVSLGKTERQANVRGAFEVVKPDRIAGKKIIVIDDVYTTGSTLNECARVLMNNGAADVAVLTLARAA
jgi:ComF family protein